MSYTAHFSAENIPFGVASSASHPNKSAATRFKDHVIFLDTLSVIKPPSLLDSTISSFSEATLNTFAATSKSEQTKTRKWIQSLLSSDFLQGISSAAASVSGVTLHLPLTIPTFSDYSCSREHVLNAGEAVFNKRELPPAFEHFPIGYHGCPTSIVVSGTPIQRPSGQYRGPEGSVVFGPTQRLDYELEIAAVIGKPSDLGSPVAIKDADEHIFGLVLLNDWSARDIQGLEMTPLGPMNGKSFGTIISPWIITLDALEPFRSPPPSRNPDIPITAYLQDPLPNPGFDIKVEASLKPTGTKNPTTICKSEFSSLYWTLRDLVAQQTVNGCGLDTGDLLATGTISGSTPESHGCLLEMAAKGGVTVAAKEGEEKRIFLLDGDTVTLSAVAGEGVGFGECTGKVLPAVQQN
ncbi:fumarylacetoacetase [Halenospora varia]|nr:fumarylacetoacetase [Halenospora varia]